jgi:hypothetical protein
MPTLVSDPTRQSAVTETARRLFREALDSTKGHFSGYSEGGYVSDSAPRKPRAIPCNRTLWHLLIIVGITITVVLGVGFGFTQSQLNTVQAHNELVVQELRELKRYMEAERKLHYYEKRGN